MKKLITIAMVCLSLTGMAKEKTKRVRQIKKTAPTVWVDDWACYVSKNRK